MNYLITCLITLLIISCSSPPPPKFKRNLMPFSSHDKVLFEIGECSRSRRNFQAKACLEKFRNHVFRGRLLIINAARTGVEAVIDIGQTEVTCHIHPSEQVWQMLKSLVVGDIVSVNGWPEEFHNAYSYNNLILSECTLLPFMRYSETQKYKVIEK